MVSEGTFHASQKKKSQQNKPEMKRAEASRCSGSAQCVKNETISRTLYTEKILKKLFILFQRSAFFVFMPFSYIPDR